MPRGPWMRRLHLINLSFLALTALLSVWRFGRAAPPVSGGGGVLELTVLDEGTDRPTPARIEVVGEGGRAHVADDALLVGGDCKDRETPWLDAEAEARAILGKTIR